MDKHKKEARIKDINFKEFNKIEKKCLWMNRDKETKCINKCLYSVEDIIEDSQYSNLYFEIYYSKYGGCMCWLWNDLGVFAFRVGFVPSDYTLNSFLRMIKFYPLAILKIRLQEDSANGNR